MDIRIVRRINQIAAICEGNRRKERICPDDFFSKFLLRPDAALKNKLLTPDELTEIMHSKAWFTGDGFAITEKGGRFKDKVEIGFLHNGQEKVLNICIPSEFQNRQDMMIRFRHGFGKGDENLIQLFNASNGINSRQIATLEDFEAAKEIIMRVIGRVYGFVLGDRNNAKFETVYRVKGGNLDENTIASVKSSASGGEEQTFEIMRDVVTPGGIYVKVRGDKYPSAPGTGWEFKRIYYTTIAASDAPAIGFFQRCKCQGMNIVTATNALGENRTVLFEKK